ncbi:hypothetical protein PPL_09334 [Heterostelium album PN500]|uniref:Glycosyl hydrolase family 13 catalytic domain-containing protein n=1 Tax=Heterostelium pallidum (strain ATCC 26659 / Pp 5 / PN500) TaxID=670386 RepID=D3BLA2_HETP5|nr:hypothetical protein PPL_09334 [Heterostelium album PN500]EFA77836.1 hypothetical protein PPL_09334 [Heterostelium album PN500]|eukprot:XP_020429964.1 hypothetical protein PPL_09334 [Heterostelium album PN500]
MTVSHKNSGVKAAVPSGGMMMYELSTRPWLYNLSQQYNQNFTQLSQIPMEEFQKIKSMGFDMVWLMGLWQLGEYGLNYDRTNQPLLQHYAQVLPGYTVDDIIGSPYAVTNYTLNTQLGSMEDLAVLRKQLNEMGLLLMVDFVPNHSAVDCEWTTTDPDYYIRAPQGTNPPYDPNTYLPSGIAYGSAGWGGAWQDTAQLNYWNPELVKVRIAQLLELASVADAIRCDMAYLLINELFGQNWQSQLQSWGYTQPATEFWQQAISIVKAEFPDTIFLAEVYHPWESQLQQLGFDYTYDKMLHDYLGSGNLDQVRGWISGNSVQFAQHSAHFCSNHDEPRAANFFGSWWRADAAALVTYTMPGLRFFWWGDFEGYQNQLDVHLRREESESAVDTVMQFYQNLTSIVSDPVFKYGTFEYLNVTGSDTEWTLIAYKWTYQNEKRLCVLNFSDTQGSGSIILSDAQPINGNDTIPVTDLLSGTTYFRSAQQLRTTGLFVVVNTWYGQIFKY